MATCIVRTQRGPATSIHRHESSMKAIPTEKLILGAAVHDYPHSGIPDLLPSDNPRCIQDSQQYPLVYLKQRNNHGNDFRKRDNQITVRDMQQQLLVKWDPRISDGFSCFGYLYRTLRVRFVACARRGETSPACRRPSCAEIVKGIKHPTMMPPSLLKAPSMARAVPVHSVLTAT